MVPFPGERQGVSGSDVLRKLVDLRVTAAECDGEQDEPPHSASEAPAPVRQLSIRDKVGRVVARPDFAYPDQRLAIECQSYRWHFGRRRWHHDLERSNELTRLGWRVLYFTWDQLRMEPDSVLDRIRSELGYPDPGLNRGRRWSLYNHYRPQNPARPFVGHTVTAPEPRHIS